MSTRFRSLPAGARAYVGVVILAGAATVFHSLYELWVRPVPWDWAILAVLTLVSGSATVRLPSLPATISVSETFVFTSVLLFGSSAGTLTVALDALVISGWSHRKGDPLYKIIFNVCALPLTLWVASHVFFALADINPLFRSSAPVDIKGLIVPLLVFTILYFSLNSWIIAFAISLEKHISAFSIWRNNFAWLVLNYVGGASVAWLLVSYTKDLDYTYLAVIVPLLFVLYFTFSMSMGRVEDANRHLTQLNTLYMSTIETLAMAIDAKDQITHGHIRRVQTYAVALAKKMGVNDPSLIRAVEAAALLHDMGKLAVPEYILNKPGPLTPAEFEKMKLHASVGADILSAIDFPYPVVPIVRHHHENWDGCGYPDGLAGTDIPVGARILSVVDCFDALTSDRPYRPRLSDKEALRILRERRGTMYDPLVVDTFIRVHTQIAPPRSANDAAPFQAITEASVATLPPPATGRRLDEITASTEEMLTLFDLARGLVSPMSLPDIGDLISKHLRRLVPCSLCVFFVYDVEHDELISAHAAGDQAALLSGLRIGLGQRLSGWVAANRQSIRNSDPALDLGDSARSMNPRPRSCLSTPLLTNGNLTGVLTLYSTEVNAFTEEHQRILEVVARQVSPIVGGASDVEKSKANSLRDRLTGLPNVEHMRQLVGSGSSTTLPEPTSLLLIDVDNLAAINDVHGQQAGDDVLSHVASAVRRSLRSADLLFRYRSDEFVALLLQTNSHTAKSIADRVRTALVADRIPASLNYSATVVAATTPADGLSIDALVDSARQKLPHHPQEETPKSTRPPESIH
jgi:diguanylate cyclase (GGDEF)-like protein/putative nucleotidyltransferase with HDIG domain